MSSKHARWRSGGGARPEATDMREPPMTATIAELEFGPTPDRKAARRGLIRAVGQNRALSRAGMAERLFALLFNGLVYPQIWEDPEVDMQALRIEPGDHLVTIASGGCNALSYLIADPARIE